MLQKLHCKRWDVVNYTMGSNHTIIGVIGTLHCHLTHYYNLAKQKEKSKETVNQDVSHGKVKGVVN